MELAGLQVGDVVRLAHPAAAPLDVTAADVVFAHATPGRPGPAARRPRRRALEPGELMTSAQVPTGDTWLHGLEDNVVPAAAAVAQLLPSAQPLTAGQPMTAADLDLAPLARRRRRQPVHRRRLVDRRAGRRRPDRRARRRPDGGPRARRRDPARARRGRRRRCRVPPAPAAASPARSWPRLVSNATVAVPLLAGGVTAAVLVLTARPPRREPPRSPPPTGAGQPPPAAWSCCTASPWRSPSSSAAPG